MDVPFKYFGLATLIGIVAEQFLHNGSVELIYCLTAGLVPANFLHISTGATLNNAAGASGGSNAVNFAILFLLQFVALLPTLFKSKLAKYEHDAFDKEKTQ